MPQLSLGPVAFADFELPPDIVFGGRQRLAVHQLPGGQRVVDAMGRDDAPLGWSGIFSGPEATTRARALDLIRATGEPVAVLWDDFSYAVIVEQFAARYERVNWVPYRIVCTVLADDSAVFATAAPTPLVSVLADLGAAGALAGIDFGAALAAVGVSGAVLGGSAANAAAAATLAVASASVARGLAASGATLAGAGDFPTLAAAAGQAAGYASARGYVLRAQANLANAGG